MNVNEENFQHDVVERSRERPVVVDFWASWCEPCQALGPILEREIEARAGELELAKVDVDANPQLAAAYDVRGIPAVKAFKDGRVVKEFVGALSPTAVAGFLDELIAPPASERLLEQLTASGEFPQLLGPLAEGDYERALEWLMSEVAGADAERKERVREVMVEIFGELGQDHPLATTYRRRLATALY